MNAAKLSVIALLLGMCAAVADGFLLTQQEDKSDLLWPLILLPVVLVPLPVLVRRQVVRAACAVAMTVWAAVTTFSIGPAFIPCVLAMWAGAMAPDSTLQERAS
jgi:hypothetical protein